MRRFQNKFIDSFFNEYARDDRLRLAVLLNEIEYNQDELVRLILAGGPDDLLSEDEIKQLRRAITILEEKLAKENLRKMPRWFWEDERFYADPRHPDFVVDNDDSSLKQLLMDRMFDGASNNFLQRSTFFDRHSLEIW
jgi:hypothetical protein